MKLISFCIPTYNRAPQCIRLVKEILKSQNEDIEVVVSDNCSTDETLALLRKIKDKRLFILTSVQNKDSLLNGLNCLSKASGKYIYLTTDKDMVNFSNIDAFVLFLKGNRVSCGYCEFSPKLGGIDGIYLQGFEAIDNVGYLGRHPSGSFFEREKLENLNYLERFSDYEFVGEFVADYMLAELASKGNAAIFRQQLAIPQDGKEAAIDKSLSIKGENKNAYYTPFNRLKTTINQTIHISNLEISRKNKERLVIKIFMIGLINATFGYKNILRNKDICEHYYLESRKVLFWELMWVGCGFYKNYLKRTKPARRAVNLHVIMFSYYVCKLALAKILKKFFYA